MGDSLVVDFPVELLTPIGAPLMLRGMPGDTIRGVAARIDETLERRPQTIVLQVGTNDVLRGRAPEAITRDYGGLLRRCRMVAPQARLIVLSLPPAIGAAGMQAVNTALRLLASQQGADFLDTFEALASANGSPKPGMLTDDGVHLTGLAYRRISELLRPHLPR